LLFVSRLRAGAPVIVACAARVTERVKIYATLPQNARKLVVFSVQLRIVNDAVIEVDFVDNRWINLLRRPVQSVVVIALISII
jgi:hypothetical protein